MDKFQLNLKRNSHIFVRENVFKNFNTLSPSQCVYSVPTWRMYSATCVINYIMAAHIHNNDGEPSFASVA